MARKVIRPFVSDVALTGSVRPDVTAVLLHHGYSRIADHVARVATEARRVATRFGADSAQAETAAWLHDVGAVVPNEQRIGRRNCW